MAKTSCINNHPMWNGDGGPVLWIYRVGFLKKYQEDHPEFVFDGRIPEIYDLVDEGYKEDLDGWYCDVCKSVAIFTENFRYDYVPKETLPDCSYEQALSWEEYIAIRDDDLEAFQDFYVGKRPYDAVESYPFRYKYRLSPDENIVLAFDQGREPVFAYELKRFIDFDKQEVQETESDNEQDFDIEQYLQMANDTAMQILGKELDFSRNSVRLLDEIVVKARSMYRKKLIDDNILWNMSVVLGTFYGEVLLKNILSARGLFWDRSKNPPALANKEGSTVIKPIDTVHHAMFVKEESADNYLWSDYGYVKLLTDMYLPE